MSNIIKIKRGLKANLTTLEIGEMGYCTDTNELFIGTDTGNVLINEGGEATETPTITEVTNEATDYTFTITNNDDYQATVYYELGTTPPTANEVTLDAGETSANLTLSVDPGTFYTLYAQSVTVGELKSNVSSKSFTTPNPFDIFTDTSGSPGASFPVNDLDGNIMANLDKGIAYYGTVSHTDLYTSDGLASAVGVTQGTSINNESVWHKYYWNDGIHFWRKTIRHSAAWTTLANAGAVYGTGTTTSRKGHSNTNVNQNAEVTKNGLTYAVRLMEGANVDPISAPFTAPYDDFYNNEFTLILLNLHAATNSGVYSDSPTDGVTYINWTDDEGYVNSDFVGWKTNLGDNNFTIDTSGSRKWQQERFPQVSALFRGDDNLGDISSGGAGEFDASISFGWAPVLTVKHSSFTYE